jgi:glycosyltransferase involved in cell wall biosynthesis
MKKILIITGKFSPDPTANVIIAKNIINELKKRGYSIFCIAINQNEEINSNHTDNFPIYPIRSTLYGKYLQQNRNRSTNFLNLIIFKILFVLRRFKNIFGLMTFPDVDWSQSKSVYKLAEKIYLNEQFDYILSLFRPYSGVSASIRMKKKHPELICGAYYLDLISGSNKPKLLPNYLYKKLCYKGDISTFSKLDFVLMAKGGGEIYKGDEYRKIQSKLIYTDFPVFVSNSNIDSLVDNINELRFMYAGTLDKHYRNPTKMLQTLEMISNNHSNVTLSIYGHGNCSTIIEKFKRKNSYKIIEYGMAPHEEVLSAMFKSDFLINISNKTQNIVPSKIFELFASGKPIINFISNVSDISIDYFRKYPSVFGIEEWSNLHSFELELLSFIEREKGKQYDVAKIKDSYFENTPESVVNKLEEILSKYK